MLIKVIDAPMIADVKTRDCQKAGNMPITKITLIHSIKIRINANIFTIILCINVTIHTIPKNILHTAVIALSKRSVIFI